MLGVAINVCCGGVVKFAIEGKMKRGCVREFQLNTDMSLYRISVWKILEMLNGLKLSLSEFQDIGVHRLLQV